MAHFALVENGIVTKIAVIANSDIIDDEGNERPELAEPLLWPAGNWIQCSYNAKFRGVYPGVGFSYDAERDVFVRPPDPKPDAESLTQSEAEA
jgi:hypothetical protein